MQKRSDRSRRRIQFERLEQRETLSTLVGGSHLIHEQRARTPSFNGSGRAVPVSATPLPGGGLATVGSVTGRAGQVGGFTGVLDTTFAPDQRHATSTAVLTVQNGDQIDLSLVGSYRNSRSPVVRGNFSFVITGGTGAFVHATGGGRLSGTLNTRSEVFSFTFNGRLTP